MNTTTNDNKAAGGGDAYPDHRTSEEASRPRMSHWTFTDEAKKAPAPTAVRQMTDEDCEQYAVDRADYPNDRLWLAVWADRSGYYFEGINPDAPECRFCASIFNESEIFETAEACHAWMWSRLEVTTKEDKAMACARALVEWANSNNRVNITGKLAEAVTLAREVWAQG